MGVANLLTHLLEIHTYMYSLGTYNHIRYTDIYWYTEARSTTSSHIFRVQMPDTNIYMDKCIETDMHNAPADQLSNHLNKPNTRE